MRQEGSLWSSVQSGNPCGCFFPKTVIHSNTRGFASVSRSSYHLRMQKSLHRLPKARSFVPSLSWHQCIPLPRSFYLYSIIRSRNPPDLCPSSTFVVWQNYQPGSDQALFQFRRTIDCILSDNTASSY